MYLLDTNICIAILKNNSNAVRAFSPHSQHSFLSTIVTAELYKGVYWSQRTDENRQAIDASLICLLSLNMIVPPRWNSEKFRVNLNESDDPLANLMPLLPALRDLDSSHWLPITSSTSKIFLV